MDCGAGIQGAGVASEWVQCRCYGSGGSSPLVMYKDSIRRGELESGNLAQVRVVDGLFFFSSFMRFFGDVSVGF